MTNFDTMEKELREKRGVISSLDFAREVVAIVTVAIDVMTNTRNKELATAIAAMKIKEAVSKLFTEEPQEEKNTEKDSKFEESKMIRLTDEDYAKLVKAAAYQLPYRPKWDSDGCADGHEVWDAYCPKCGAEIDECDNFCPACGQSIDWNDGKEE